MLRQRVITALILVPITLLVLFYLPIIPFGIVTGLVVIACAWEWTNLMQMRDVSLRVLYLVLFIAVMLSMVALPIPMHLFFVFTFLWWLFAGLLILLYPYGHKLWSEGIIWRGLMGIMVLVPSWVAINFIRAQSDGLYALLFLFVLIWGADSAAYFVGKQWGKTKLAPQISPGKSWQGLLGALAFTVLISIVVLWLTRPPLKIWPWAIMLSLITVVFSVVGDLFESMLKRQAGIKDSSRILPGHGGLLDRIDSLTAAAPVFTFGAIVLGMFFN